MGIKMITSSLATHWATCGYCSMCQLSPTKHPL